jgi:hypothetical protein
MRGFFAYVGDYFHGKGGGERGGKSVALAVSWDALNTNY